MTYRGKRRSGPWYRDGRELLQFEYGVRREVPGLRRSIHRSGLHYELVADVPYYEPRRVAILFRPWHESPSVTVDGPSASPHRFDNGALCMWYRPDGVSQMWVRDDKLLALIGIITRHLFKEAWWRETGTWLGPEVAHSAKTEKSTGVVP